MGIDAVRASPRVTYTTQGRIFFGEADNSVPGQRVLRVKALFDRAGIAYVIPPDMIRTLWWKFMINVGVNQASAALKAPYGEFQRQGAARDLMESAMREVVALARASGVHLSDADIDDWYTILPTLSPLGKTSMLQDVEGGRKTEAEMFAGKVIEMGERYGVPTPVNQYLFDAIRTIEAARA